MKPKHLMMQVLTKGHTMIEAAMCHTPDECVAMYAAISAERKAPALKVLVEVVIPANTDARLSAQYWDDAAKGWWKGRMVGMALRNLLRSRGFDEAYFGVHNLDDIYVFLIEEVLHPQQIPPLYDPSSIAVLNSMKS